MAVNVKSQLPGGHISCGICPVGGGNFVRPWTDAGAADFGKHMMKVHGRNCFLTEDYDGQEAKIRKQEEVSVWGLKNPARSWD